jgi:hypothetical protein
MKQQGKYIAGDPIRIDRYTSDWMSIRMHPTTYYRRQDEIIDGLKKTKSLYTEMDHGQYIVFRFLDKEDVTAFHRRHHQYI